MPLYRWKKYKIELDEDIISGTCNRYDEEWQYYSFYLNSEIRSSALISPNKPIPQLDGSYLFDRAPSGTLNDYRKTGAINNEFFSWNTDGSAKTVNTVYFLGRCEIGYEYGAVVVKSRSPFPYTMYTNNGVKYTDLNEYVYSSNPNAYPNGGVSGDFYYDSRTEFRSVESIGVANVARMVTAKDIGVSGIARKCKSGYVGVSGVSRRYFVPIK